MRILIAEGDQASRLIVLKSLEKLGHDCVQTESGTQALEMFFELKPDVVISDLVMPGLDGLELSKKIRADSGKFVYFILLTNASDGGDSRVAALEAGVDDVLINPVDKSELQGKLINAARVIALHRQLGDQKVLVERLNRELYDDSRRDPLTRVGNRLRMQEDLETLCGRAERYNHGFALALFDIDDFRKYNETCGTAAGDDILRSVSRTLANHARSGDMTYRYGGEEFVVVLPEQGLDGSVIAVERRRRAVEALGIPHPGRGADGIVTVSVGVAALEPGDRGAIDGLMRRAEAALQHAKSTGKNRMATEIEARAAAPKAELGAQP